MRKAYLLKYQYIYIYAWCTYTDTTLYVINKPSFSWETAALEAHSWYRGFFVLHFVSDQWAGSPWICTFYQKKKKKRQQCFETTQTVVQGMLAHYNSVSVLEFVRNYEGKARNNVAGLRLCIKWVFCVCNSHNISCATTYSIVSGKNMMAVQGESPSLEFIWRRGELIRWFCAFLFTNNA